MQTTLRDLSRKARPHLSRLADAVFPARCGACRAPVGENGALCVSCWGQIHFISEPVCRRCGLPFDHPMGEGALCGGCLQRPPVYSEARAVLRYDHASRLQVLALKYQDKTQLAPVFGEWLARAASLYASRAQAIVPVPLHYWRLLKRRYNQSALLAHALGKRTGLPVWTDALARVRPTPPQRGLSRTGRIDNVRGAFRTEEGARWRLKGSSVLLVDDVMTTGATLDACARALHDAGVRDVYAITLARAVVGD